jgi:hypothetical protein
MSKLKRQRCAGGAFLMTPDQHRNQAELLSRSQDPEAQRRAELHMRLAAVIEKRARDAAARAEGQATP